MPFNDQNRWHLQQAARQAMRTFRRVRGDGLHDERGEVPPAIVEAVYEALTEREQGFTTKENVAAVLAAAWRAGFTLD